MHQGGGEHSEGPISEAFTLKSICERQEIPLILEPVEPKPDISDTEDSLKKGEPSELYFDTQFETTYKLLQLMKSETIWNYERRRDAVTCNKELKKAQCVLLKEYRPCKTLKHFVYEEEPISLPDNQQRMLIKTIKPVIKPTVQ